EVLHRIFQSFPQIEQVFLFGSRAKGTAKRASDIDLAVVAPEMSPVEWAKFLGALNESPIILMMDAIHLDRLRDEALRARISEEGIEIYAR
ncbi:MAG: nucleotidyltransferase domain-containing protein, partial [Candidatus Hydrogenedentes bacterium]|nr:nucleotidyltransferase domain-containing protein [Candidatus Hydrogenedentota bacterium]